MKNLDVLLKHIAAESTPALPGNFGQSVWRAIRQRKAKDTEPGWVDSIITVLFYPKLAASALAVALLVGVTLTAFEASTPDATESLGLQVFSAHAPTLPSTLIGRRM